MTHLSVNINKVATLRNTRALNIPNVARFAALALDAGAHGITIHPRPDQRHIHPHDVDDLAALLAQHPNAEFNIEGNPFFDFMPHVRRVRPTQCTLVPDTTEAFTSDHGWSLTAEVCEKISPLITEMKKLGCRVSLFMDADSPDFERVKALGADRVELYTEPYAAAFAKGDDIRERSFTVYAQAANRAHAAGLALNAGHDLNLENLRAFLERVPHIAEVSIGHALIADALEFGMTETIKKYLRVCITTHPKIQDSPKNV